MAKHSGGEIRTRTTLSKAEKGRREQRKKIKKYPEADFSNIGPDPEPTFPVEIPAYVVAYILEELRRAVRNRKSIYGARLCDTLQAAFGLFKVAEAKCVTDWINWLVRNRHELIAGKYGPGFIYEGPPAPEPGAGKTPTQASALPQAKVDMGGKALERDLPAPVSSEDVLEKAGQPQSFDLPNGRSGTTPPVQSPRQLDRHEALAAAPRDSMHSEVDEARDLTTDSAHLPAPDPKSNSTLEAASNAVPKMPAKPTFRFRQYGAQKANRFLGGIHFNEPLEKVRQHAKELAADQNDLDEVMNRGPSEQEYIRQAMRDLAVDLP